MWRWGKTEGPEIMKVQNISEGLMTMLGLLASEWFKNAGNLIFKIFITLNTTYEKKSNESAALNISRNPNFRIPEDHFYKWVLFFNPQNNWKIVHSAKRHHLKQQTVVVVKDVAFLTCC